ncbi:MAG: 5'/3'-nucleotidase SurE, partial [Acidobacteriota bacterium]|nr:5'/3'-nucleotidase SurE [Acidobacteriota bacterium]
TLLHIPSIAVSVGTDDRGRADFTVAARFSRRISQQVLEHGLPDGAYLNVNVPAGEPRGVRITRQGTRSYRAAIDERLDPSGRPYYWIASPDSTPAGESDGDHRAIDEGYVSVTPLHANLTDEPTMSVVAGWNVSL